MQFVILRLETFVRAEAFILNLSAARLRAVRKTLPRENAVTLDTSCFVVSKSFLEIVQVAQSLVRSAACHSVECPSFCF